ncbi:MAG: hypothetical protein V4547_16345 [Bacteroidota bacterium]
MSGFILDAARKDAELIVSSIGFEETIFIETKDGSLKVELKGLNSKHSLGFDDNGNSVNSKTARITVIEKHLAALNYPVRNSVTGEVDLKKHRVTVKDSTLIEKYYVVNENIPNETFGTITLILGNYTPAPAN